MLEAALVDNRTSAVPERDSEAARRAYQRTKGINGLGRHDGIGERHIHHGAILPGDHAIEAAARHQVHGMDAEGLCHQPIAPGRRAAALDMPEHGDTNLGAGEWAQHLREAVTDATIAAGLALPHRLTP